MAFLSMYLAGKVSRGDGKGHLSKLLLVLLPLAVAALVGVSRLDDYKHHWQDVVAGALIGRWRDGEGGREGSSGETV